ncbi:MAG: DUF4349 domain-containing protein [Ruminococcaceae bacterium]|nr:DUF4349 domain-containing protein [Oscillospiraceae bacterium]
MKKIICALLLITLCICSVACSKYENYSSDIYDEALPEKNESIVDTELGSTASDRKIIERITMTVETKTFDTLLEQINSQIKELDGYIQNSDVNGNKIDSDNYRYANIVIRIPSKETNNFSEFIATNSAVTNKKVTTEDVTLSYVDIESRIAALEAEKTALEQLLASASSVQDIVTIRAQLTDVIASIESYKSQLRVYDSLIAYSTITLYIHEVDTISVEPEPGTWQKIGTNLKNNFAGMWSAVKAVFIFFVSIIPYLIPQVIIAAVVITIIKLARAKKRKAENK